MPNQAKPIEEATIWDVLSWNRVCELAAEASGDPRDGGGRNLWPWLAKDLIDAGAVGDKAAEVKLHTIISSVAGYGKDAERRTKVGIAAEKFGADPLRLIEFAAFKWGLFSRTKP